MSRKVWEEIGHCDYVYVRRDKDNLIVSVCLDGKSDQEVVDMHTVKHSTTDPVIVTARRLLQRLRKDAAAR